MRFCLFVFVFVLLCFVLLCFVLFCFVFFCFVLFCFVLFCLVLLCFFFFFLTHPVHHSCTWYNMRHSFSVYRKVVSPRHQLTFLFLFLFCFVLFCFVLFCLFCFVLFCFVFFVFVCLFVCCFFLFVVFCFCFCFFFNHRLLLRKVANDLNLLAQFPAISTKSVENHELSSKQLLTTDTILCSWN